MSQVITLAGLGILAYLFYAGQASEGYQSSPDAPQQFTMEPVTHDLIFRMVKLTIPEVARLVKVDCESVYPIETTFIRPDASTGVYHCRFMFMIKTPSQFPYSLDVASDVKDGVATVMTQSPNIAGDLPGFDGSFETSSALAQEPLPNLNQLQTAFGLA